MQDRKEDEMVEERFERKSRVLARDIYAAWGVLAVLFFVTMALLEL